MKEDSKTDIRNSTEEGNERSISNDIYNGSICISQDYSSSKLKNNFDKNTQTAYTVEGYATECEEHMYIEQVVLLKISTCNVIMLIITNIITIGLINLFMEWFSCLKLSLNYSKATINDATYVVIYGKGGKLTFEKLTRTDLPKIPMNMGTGEIVAKFNLNVPNIKNIIYFKYMLFTYVFNEYTLKFNGLQYRINTTQKNFIDNYTGGLYSCEVDFMRTLFGVCDIDVKMKSWFSILLIELTDPFYLFQICSVIMWYCNEYTLYATVIIIMAVGSLTLSTMETYQNMKKIQQMSRYSLDVDVYRKNEEGELVRQRISSTQLVPGDIFLIPEDDLVLPCDCTLVSGSVIINEAMLTGESTPVTKTRVPGSEKAVFDSNDPDMDKFTLYSGTKVVQRRALEGKNVLGFVGNIGFNSVKGNLIRAILFPKEMDDSFMRDSVKYIILMGIICILGYLASLKFLIDSGLGIRKLILRFLDLITTTVPPSLPACLSIGITYSLGRLKTKSISCIYRDRVNVAGAVNALVFDKTGTLTEDHLDIYGFLPNSINENKKFSFKKFCKTSKNRNQEVYNYVRNKWKDKKNKKQGEEIKQYFIECLACCHTLTKVHGRLVGDPIDVRMFEDVGWSFAEKGEDKGSEYDALIREVVKPGDDLKLAENYKKSLNIPITNEEEDPDEIMEAQYEIGIVRQFEFSSKLQRMTTVCRNVKEPHFKVFSKGSPEKIKTLCRPETLPPNYSEVLDKFARRGFRLLALAAKPVKVAYKHIQTVSREALERHLIFLGFLVVQNRLKKATKGAINDLDMADLKMAMATGDNILTAISVAKECGLIKSGQEIYHFDIEKNDLGHDTLIFSKIDEKEDDNNNEIIDENSDFSYNYDEDIENNNTNNISYFNDMTVLNNTVLSNTLNDLNKPKNNLININKHMNNVSMDINNVSMCSNNTKIRLCKGLELMSKDDKMAQEMCNSFYATSRSSEIRKSHIANRQNINIFRMSTTHIINNKLGTNLSSGLRYSNALNKAKSSNINTNNNTNAPININNISNKKNDQEDLNSNLNITNYQNNQQPNTQDGNQNNISNNKPSIAPNNRKSDYRFTECISIRPSSSPAESGSERNTKKNMVIEEEDEDQPVDIEDEMDILSRDNFIIAIGGKVFERLFKANEVYKKNPTTDLYKLHTIFRLILSNGVVFARMSPEGKAMLVQALKEEGLTTLMCGDGANDCAALHYANVGVSLSAEEASIAAHFTSNIPDISAVVKVLKEGKCSLTTSIQTFKYMMIYSIIQFISVTLLSILHSYLGDGQFLISDLFIIFPLAWFISLTGPAEKLTYHTPESSLLSLPIVSCVIFNSIVCFIFQLGGRELLKYKFGYTTICTLIDDDFPEKCQDNTILFLIANFQYLFTGIALSTSYPFREEVYKNWMLIVYYAMIITYSVSLVIYTDPISKDFFDLFDFYEDSEEKKEINKQMKYWLMAIIAINFIIEMILERVLIAYINNCWENKKVMNYKKEKMEVVQRINKGEMFTLEEEFSLFKYLKVYYFNRRKEMESDMKRKGSEIMNKRKLSDEEKDELK